MNFLKIAYANIDFILFYGIIIMGKVGDDNNGMFLYLTNNLSPSQLIC